MDTEPDLIAFDEPDLLLRELNDKVSAVESKIDSILWALQTFDQECYDFVKIFCDQVDRGGGDQEDREAHAEKLEKSLQQLRTTREKQNFEKLRKATSALTEQEASRSQEVSEIQRLTHQNMLLKDSAVDAERKANVAKQDLNRLVVHSLMHASSKKKVAEYYSPEKPKCTQSTQHVHHRMAPQARGTLTMHQALVSVPLSTFSPLNHHKSTRDVSEPPLTPNTAETFPSSPSSPSSLPFLPQSTAVLHPRHNDKKSSKAAVVQRKLLTLQRPDTRPIQDPPPVPSLQHNKTMEGDDGFRLCVAAFSADLLNLAHDFGYMRATLSDEQDRLLATLLHHLGLGRAPSAVEPSASYTELASFGLSGTHPVFATDRASRLLARLEGDGRYSSDVGTLRSAWDGLVAYLDHSLRAQMVNLGIFLDAVQRVTNSEKGAEGNSPS